MGLVAGFPPLRSRVRDWVCHVGFCGGQSGAGVDFLRVLRFPLPNFIPPIAPEIILIYHRGLYNRPKWPQYQGLRYLGTQYRPTNNKKIILHARTVEPQKEPLLSIHAHNS
jgi:hypothetical protein